MTSGLVTGYFVALLAFGVACDVFGVFGRTNKRAKWLLSLTGVAALAYSSLAILGAEYIFFAMVGDFILLFCASFAFDMSKSKSALCSLALVLFRALAGYCIYEILGLFSVASETEMIFIQILAENVPIQIFYGIIWVFCQYAVFKFCLLGKRIKNNTISAKYAAFEVAVPIISLIILAICGALINAESEIFQILILVVALILVCANIAMSVVFWRLTQGENSLILAQKQMDELERERKNYQKMISASMRSNKEMHDLKNKLFAVNSYIDEDIDKAKSALSDICDSIYQSQVVKFTGLNGLDTLINVKEKDAEKVGVNIKKNIKIFGDINIDEIDLCVVVGNLLNNAIEGVAECAKADAFIQLNILTKANMLSIVVKNSTISTTFELGASTKQDNFQHGFGLQNVLEIADKYAGSGIFDVKDGIFTSSVLLQNMSSRDKR